MALSRPSVQSLLIQLLVDGKTLGTGTAFVAMGKSGPLLITNRHNVTGRRQDDGKPISPTGGVPDAVVVVHNRKGKLGEWIGVTEPLYAGTAPRWIEHPHFGAEADFVALPLTQIDDAELYPYDVIQTGPLIRYGPAELVSVVGFPFGIQGGGSLAIWATGFVASEPEVDLDGLPVFLIDCRSRQGQSGSAVIAHRSGAVVMEDGNTHMLNYGTRFLGIYSGRVNEQSDLGIVWKAKAIADLVGSVK